MLKPGKAKMWHQGKEYEVIIGGVLLGGKEFSGFEDCGEDVKEFELKIEEEEN